MTSAPQTTPFLFDVTEVQRLGLKPGDTLVMRAPEGMRLSHPQRVNATEALQQFIASLNLGFPVHALVLDGGWDLKVVGPDASA